MAIDKPRFLAELKRRNVLRAAVLYIGAVWALSQGIAQLGPLFDAPNWAMRAFVIACVIGFPFWLAFAWFYEFTSHGIKRDSEVAADAPARHSNARKLDFAIIAVLVVAVALLASGYFVHRRPAAPVATAATAIPAQSIAVLPFENLSNDEDNEYFVAGMQDLILTKLADIGSLKVIARTSTQNYGSHPENLTLVGQQLGVATILEGSVQKAGNEVLINVQLIDAKTDSHIWAESYTRTLDNIFGVEGEVATSIAKSLNAKLTSTEDAELARVATTNKAAYEAYLRAQYFSEKAGTSGTPIADAKAGITAYHQAIAADPTFALAYAYLSQGEIELANLGASGEDVAKLNRQARTDAEAALKLQPGLPAAQLALGWCDMNNQDYPAALKSFAAVLAVRPNDDDALYSQGAAHLSLGQFDAALASFKQAVVLSPRKFGHTVSVGTAYMSMGRYAEAEDWFQRALALQPDGVSAKIDYAYAILYGSGDIPRALAVVQGDASALKQMRAHLLTLQRKFPEAIALLQSIPDTSDNFPPGSSKAGQLGGWYWLADDRASARAQFAKAVPADRAALGRLQGSSLANVWNSVAFDEIGVGDSADGLASVAKSEALLDAKPDVLINPSYMLNNAEAYAMAGRADLAVPLLEKALAAPGIGGSYSPLMLWLDPYWDPIRHSPQFQILLKRYAKDKPAVTYDNPPAASATSSPAA